MAEASERPISDTDAEGFVIGSIIQDPSCLGGIDLDPEDFYSKEYRQLFEAILALRDRGAEINRASINRESLESVKSWVLDKVTDGVDPLESLYYADIVKEMSRQRRLVSSVDKAMGEFRKGLSSQELADRLRLCLDTLDYSTNSSRTVTVSNPRIVQAAPPTYELTVSTTNGKVSADIKFTSSDLDKPVVFRKKVREQLGINPLLPKKFDAFIHQILQEAQNQEGPGDASADESASYWIREWFSAASEAEHQDDLPQGYLDRDGAYWFSADRLVAYVSERSKEKLDRSSLWSVIHNRGGRRSKIWRIGEKRARLWGIDHAFFQEEGLAEGEQVSLQADDLKWLEGD